MLYELQMIARCEHLCTTKHKTCGNLQKVKAVFDSNVIGQMSEFKYLEYPKSYKRIDVDIKLQSCTEINGLVREMSDQKRK
jgi:hypothetical protein